MAIEYDHQAGFDLASVDQPTRVQLMQAFNQLAYLSNRAGIVFSATSPDVTLNPHLKRYAWLDTSGGTHPVLMLYDQSEAAGVNNAGNWASTPIAAGSITNTQINAAAAIAVTKLAFGTARYVLRTNAAGTANEFVAPASINTVNEIPVNNLVVAAGDSYLKTVGGSVVWVTQATERAAIQAAITGLNPVQIAAGAAGRILGVSGGITAWLTPDTAIGAAGLSPTALSQAGAATGDILRWTGLIWDKVTPTLGIAANLAINLGVVVSVLGGAVVFTQAHGLGAVPKLIKAVVRCDTADNGFVAFDELGIECLRDAGNPSAGISADSVNITVTLSTALGNSIPNKGTGVFAAMTEANWSLKLYAWK